MKHSIIRLFVVGILITSMQIHSAARYTLPPDHSDYTQQSTIPESATRDRSQSVVPNYGQVDEEVRKAKIKNGPPAFELRNKMSVPVQITLENGDLRENYSLSEKKRSLKGEIIDFHQSKIDKDKQTRLILAFSQPNGPAKKKTYFLPAGRFLFISFEDGVLKPQKGSDGKTQSGLIIPKNNITQHELHRALEDDSSLEDEDEDDGFDDE